VWALACGATATAAVTASMPACQRLSTPITIRRFGLYGPLGHVVVEKVSKAAA
jgi:hypothetical protein